MVDGVGKVVWRYRVRITYMSNKVIASVFEQKDVHGKEKWIHSGLYPIEDVDNIAPGYLLMKGVRHTAQCVLIKSILNKKGEPFIREEEWLVIRDADENGGTQNAGTGS